MPPFDVGDWIVLRPLLPVGLPFVDSCKWPPDPAPLFVLILASPQPHKLEILRQNIMKVPEYAACTVIFHENPMRTTYFGGRDASLLQILTRCKSACVLQDASWTEALQRAAPFALIQTSFPDGIFILNDDVQLNFRIDAFVAKAHHFSLDAGSPMILNSHGVMRPRRMQNMTLQPTLPHGVGWHRSNESSAATKVLDHNKTRATHQIRDSERPGLRLVSVIEPSAQWFSQKAWKCYWDLLDPLVNGGGYGLEYWMRDWCHRRLGRAPRIALLEEFTLTSAPNDNQSLQSLVPSRGFVGRSGGRAGAWARAWQMHAQEDAWKARGVTLTSSWS